MSNTDPAAVADARAKLLIEFVFHCRRGNLLPYEEHFREQVVRLCELAEKHFTHSVDPFAPMPEPLPV
ncbi:MAG: hypothetical protein P4L99_28050 [Chthoniobacter sp.]|nr:hypothetical protein [Chthoniobacter sp.]